MESDKNTQRTPERLYFKFFRSFYKAIDNLPDDIQLSLYRGIVSFALDFQEPDFSSMENAPFIQAIWEGFRPVITNGISHYLNGANGGAPEGNQNAKKQPKNNQETTEKQAPYKDKGKGIKDKGISMEDQESLVFPFHSQKFFELWAELCRQPKWRKKTLSTLQTNLDRLSSYPEAFSLELIEAAIANNTQGLVYPSTPADFKKWEKGHQAGTRSETAAGPGRPWNPRIDLDPSAKDDESTI